MASAARRVWMQVLRIAVTAAILWFIVRSIAGNWASYRAAHVAITWHPGWLAAMIGWIALTYALQIESWRRVLAGWGQRLTYPHAAEAWCLANLGRYVPGKVWSVAGLVVIAQRRGVEMWASAASAFAVQGLGLATSLAIIVITLPGYLNPVLVVVGAAGALASFVVLGSQRLLAPLARLAGDRFPIRPLPLGTILSSNLLTLASWATYGVAFWSLARGLGYGAGTAFTPWAAMGMFAAGYMVGLLALAVPGGVVVRETAFTTFLTPLIGAGGAIAVSLASRLVLTITEALSAGVAMLIARGAGRLETNADEPDRGQSRD